MANANIVKKAEAKLPSLSLDMIESDASNGLENISSDDQAIPRLKILMQLSPELDELRDKGAKPGDIYNTVTEELYDGAKGLKVLPCAFKREYVEWTDRGRGSTGMPANVFSSSSDIMTKTTRDENNKDRLENGNYIETCGNHYVIIFPNGHSSEAIITMKATQLKKSRKWNSMLLNLKIKNSKGISFTPPAYSHYYLLKTVKEGNDKGSWYGWEISRGEMVDNADDYNTAKSFSESVNKGEIKVKYEEESAKDQKVPF